jgi:hypothetical protein
MSKTLFNVTASLFFTFSLSSHPGQTMEENLEGFSKLHATGITGKGTKVCVIESKGCHVNHPVFQEVRDQIKFISVGRASNLPVGFKECSRYRYPDAKVDYSYILAARDDQNGPHGTHAGALIVSKPQQHEEALFFPGGVAPDAQMIFIATSRVQLNDFWQTPTTRNAGTALYSFKDADQNIKLDIQVHKDFDFENKNFMDPNDGWMVKPEEYLSEYEHRKEFSFSSLRSSTYYQEKIDDSLVDAFDQAFKSGAKVLNFSMILQSIADPLNEYRIPEVFLQKIAQGLVANDQILVLAANNQSRDLGKYKEQVYFRQFSEIPDISSRMLIVANVYIDKEDDQIKRFYSGNWPGKDLHNYTVSAFGTDVVSGYSLEGSEVFHAVSGTSQAVPKVSGFCLLIEQFHKDKGQLITASEIVDFVKQTAKPLGDPEIFGKGLMNPGALLS